MAMFPAYLVDRYHRFRDADYTQLAARYRELTEKGQSPQVLIISCCDSRVEPERIFNALPGELFVVRNVANLVPPFETGGGYHGVSAAVEFAVLGLKVKDIVVLGHASCGGIAAALAQEPGAQPETQFVSKWVSMLTETRAQTLFRNQEKAREELQLELELAGIQTSLKNLRTFPFIADLESKGALSLHGAHFGIAEGKLSVLDTETGQFENI